MEKQVSYIQLYLRIALGVGFLVPGLDRLGVWGPHGGHQVSWGDWSHFSAYAKEVMSFLPAKLAEFLAVIATICEISFGVLLLIGWLTRWAAIGAGVLTLIFALSMAVSFGIVAPLSYSVFAVSAGSFLLSTLSHYPWSVDSGLARGKR
jgi:putative oxidoreductase